MIPIHVLIHINKKEKETKKRCTNSDCDSLPHAERTEKDESEEDHKDDEDDLQGFDELLLAG